MHILLVKIKVESIPNSVIGKSSLPYLRVSADQAPECMRISALDQLHGTFDGYFASGSEQEMNMIGHEDKGMQCKAPLAPILVNSFHEQSRVRFNDEESAPLPYRKGHKIGSWRRDESYRLQEKPQRLKPNTISKPNSARVNSCPSRSVFLRGVSISGRTDQTDSRYI